MCILAITRSTEAAQVEGTHIFGRFGDGDTQWLAFEMTLESSIDTALVLPIPASAGDSLAVRFVDLEAYPALFDDLTGALPIWNESNPTREHSVDQNGPAGVTLPAHEVSAYDARFVPSIADMTCLDPQFRLAPQLLMQMPQYADWGFVIFRLGATGKRKRMYPIAFQFRTRRPDALFIPAVCVHDGQWRMTSRFDHEIYFQGTDLEVPQSVWYHGARPLTDAVASYSNPSFVQELKTNWWGYGQLYKGQLGRFKAAEYGIADGGQPIVRVEKSHGVLRSDEPIWGLGASGLLENSDLWIRRSSPGATGLPIKRAQLPTPWRKEINQGIEYLDII